MIMPTTAHMPNIRRPDATAVFVSHRYVPDRAHGLATSDALVERWRGADRPPGLLSVSCYLNTDEDTVLTYVQCADADSYRTASRSLPGIAALAQVEYRLRRSVVLEEGAGEPGCMIIATFDVDGPERQERIIDSLADTIERASGTHHRGMLTANFHASVDGTRVLNYAEWTTDEAHVAFLSSATRQATLRTSNSLPGVRPIGFRRYHLYRSISS
jgi:hypothetical protein